MTIRFRNLREFESELREFAVDVVPRKALELQQKIALELLTRIVKRTPVDTGRARGNWQVNLGPASESSVVTQDTNGGATIAEGAVTISGAPEFGLITIFNNVNYITFLEGGSSKQTNNLPGGIVALSIAEVRSIFR